MLAETARQIAASPASSQPVLDAGIEKAAGTSPSARGETLEVQRGRNLLRRELMRRLKPLDAIDAALFLQINHLWHPKALDRFFSWFSFLMTGGHAWALAVLIRALVDRRRGVREFFEVLPPLYLATLTVEGPIKAYCRRHRPFISLVRAIVVGRKPGSYSFPSGHSAAAFAGASLLLRRYPRVTPFVVGIAFLVAFSRVLSGCSLPWRCAERKLCGNDSRSHLPVRFEETLRCAVICVFSLLGSRTAQFEGEAPADSVRPCVRGGWAIGGIWFLPGLR